MRPLRRLSIAALRFCGVTPPLFRIVAGVAVFLQRQAEQQPLDGDKTVAGFLGGLFRGVESTRQVGREVNLARAASGNFWQFVERVLGRLEDRARIASRTVDETAGETLAVVQQHFEHVQWRKLLVAIAHRQRLRRLDKAARPLGVFFNIHRSFPSACRSAPKARKPASSLGFLVPQAALTFLSRPPVVAGQSRRLGANVGTGPGKRKGRLHKIVQMGPG